MHVVMRVVTHKVLSRVQILCQCPEWLWCCQPGTPVRRWCRLCDIRSNDADSTPTSLPPASLLASILTSGRTSK